MKDQEKLSKLAFELIQNPETATHSCISELFKVLTKIASASPDLQTKVGSFVFDKKKKHVVLMACNDLPHNIAALPNRLKRPEKYNWIICSERNLIYQAAYHGISLKNTVLFANRLPCIECTKALIQSGIKNIILIGHIDEQIEQFTDIYIFIKDLCKEAKVSLHIYNV
ncbi:MAG: hypothetical protein II942_04910 [Alphaproteobacteria bacterium]|nr:hypothetical protein [Alphaproteobacteria bacterium]